MTDRFVTVPDSLELPAAVKVPSARLSDSGATGRAALAAANAAALRAAAELGSAATTAATDYAARDDALPYLDLERLVATHAATPLTTPTYDASGQAVHPDVIVLSEPFAGYRYWMAMTPYTNGSEAVENPSILASHDGATWIVPDGLTNPIDTDPPRFLADPCLILDGGTLYCIYNGGMAKSSADGISWSARSTVTFGAFAGSNKMSPSIVREGGGPFHYWCVDGTDSPNVLYHATGLTPLTYGDLTACTLTGGPPGRDLWHVAMREVRGGFVGAFTYCNLNANGSGGTLHLATSPDGVTWKVGAAPVLSGTTAIEWVSSMVYRACLVPTTGLGGIWGRLWYSARSLAGEWRIGYTNLTSHALTTGITNTAAGTGAQAKATGTFNTAIGALAESALSTGIGNTAVGYEAAKLASTGSGNVAIGNGALYAPKGRNQEATTTASRQTAVGTESGQATTSESNNIVTVGYRATAGGHAAVAIGSESAALHGHSVAIGLNSTTTALYQVALGARHIEITEVTAPGVAVANGARLYVKDNGAGKTQLCVIFQSGAEIILATEA